MQDLNQEQMGTPPQILGAVIFLKLVHQQMQVVAVGLFQHLLMEVLS